MALDACLGMTKKDFEKLAAIAAEMVSTEYHRDAGVWFAHKLADLCSAENDRFNRARFLKACGVTP